MRQFLKIQCIFIINCIEKVHLFLYFYFIFLLKFYKFTLSVILDLHI